LIDRHTNQKVKVDNIVVVFSDMEVIDEKLRMAVFTVGTKNAIAFINGRMFKLKYEKDGYSLPTRFLYKGEDFKFKKGNIFIHVVPLNKKIKVKRKSGVTEYYRNTDIS